MAEHALRRMEVERISAPLGAVVRGVDVRAVTGDELAQLNALFLAHHVLVFPGQNLTPRDQVAFASRWGELLPFPYMALDGYPNLIELRNRGKARDVNQHWHTDMSYDPRPPKLTMLYALEAPGIGGETAFANQTLAYQELSVGLKRLIDDLHAHHSAKGLARLYGEDEAKASEALHPVARAHDETGEKALYVCRAFTRRFEEWTREESRPLLEYLFEHAIRPEYQGRHQWRKGDLVMWDNRCLLHFAVHNHGDDERVMHRCQVAGTPVA